MNNWTIAERIGGLYRAYFDTTTAPNFDFAVIFYLFDDYLNDQHTI